MRGRLPGQGKTGASLEFYGLLEEVRGVLADRLSLGDQEALITPTKKPGEETLPAAAVLTFHPSDYRDLCRLAAVQGRGRRLWGCELRAGFWEGVPLTVAAPALGAPYAVLVLEKLVALGARRVLALGWCGSVDPRVRAGHLLLPDGAFPGDGTSPHYLIEPGLVPLDQKLHELLATGLRKISLPWHTGPVWTTDGFYRETFGLVRFCQRRGVLALEMELAALAAVARFRGIALAGLYVVSDELFDLSWRPAHGSPEFRRARNAALPLILDTLAATEEHDA